MLTALPVDQVLGSLWRASWQAAAMVPIILALQWVGVLGVVDDQSELRRRVRMIAAFRRGRRQPVLALLFLLPALLLLTDARVGGAAQAASVPVLGAANPVPTLLPTPAVASPGPASQTVSPLPPSLQPDRWVEVEKAWVPPSAARSNNGLETRIFRVNPNAFRDGLENLVSSLDVRPKQLGPVAEAGGRDSREVAPSSAEFRELSGNTEERRRLGERMRSVFEAAGVPLDPPNQFFYSTGTGVLMVRAKPAELETIQKVIEILNLAPPQVQLEVKVVEMAAEESRALGFDWFLGNTLSSGVRFSSDGPGGTPGAPAAGPAPGAGAASSEASAGRPQVDSAVPGSLSLTGILTDPQFRVVVRALEQRGAADTLFAPRVTTLSGRQARISAAGGGFTIDLLPVVDADGYSVELTLMFAADHLAASPQVDPARHSLQISTAARVWDGQTLVLGGVTPGTAANPGAAPASSKRLFVFITPTIIDPAGNPVHSPDNLPYDPNTVPMQAPGTPTAGSR